eukprot:365833-Chlamydomonas_euryale.AAC.3
MHTHPQDWCMHTPKPDAAKRSSDVLNGRAGPGRRGGRAGAMDPGGRGGRAGAMDPGRRGGRAGAMDPGGRGGRAGAMDPGRRGGRAGAMDPGGWGGRAGADWCHGSKRRGEKAGADWRAMDPEHTGFDGCKGHVCAAPPPHSPHMLPHTLSATYSHTLAHRLCPRRATPLRTCWRWASSLRPSHTLGKIHTIHTLHTVQAVSEAGYPVADALALGGVAAHGWGMVAPDSAQRVRTAGHRANQLLGGVLLHQTRHDISREVVTPASAAQRCGGSNDHLINGCVSPRESRYNFADGGSFGTDPAFYNRSDLFVAGLLAGQYYNTTACADSDDAATCLEVDRYGAPYGFEPLTFRGMPDGYPLVLDSHLPRDRLLDLLTYLADGMFLDRGLSKTLTVRFATFNADARAFGFGQASFVWERVGVHMYSEVRSVPAVDYSGYIAAGNYGAFVADWIVIGLVVFYAILTTVNVLKSFRAQGLIPEDHAPTGVQMTPDEVYRRKLHAKVRVQARMNAFWVAYEYTMCVLMVIAVGLQFYYIFGLSPNVPAELRYDVYDADIKAPARPFLLKRDDAGFSASQYAEQLGMGLGDAFGSSTAAAQPNGMPSPGDPYRWALPADASGLQGLADLYTSITKMFDVYTGYSFLQGIVLVMLMLRLIVHMSFQPKLGLLSRVLMRTAPDVAHFALLLVVCAAMFAMLITTVYGYRVESVSTYGAALTAVLEYVVVKSGKTAADSFGVDALMPENYDLRPIERVMAYVVFLFAPFYCVWILLNFFVAMIIYPYVWIKHHTPNDEPTLWHDLRQMAAWTRQEALSGAPTNKRTEDIVGWLLMPRIGNNWWYNTIYRAVVANQTKKAAGRKLAGNRLRTGAGTEKMLELGAADAHHRYDFAHLLAEFDAFFERDPAAETQAAHLLSDPRVREGRLYRLVKMLRRRAADVPMAGGATHMLRVLRLRRDDGNSGRGAAGDEQGPVDKPAPTPAGGLP